jgi:hypothetical protein
MEQCRHPREGDAAGWQIGGFIAGFCSAGWRIAMADRLWTDPNIHIDPGPLVRTIPADVDGLFLPGVTGSGPFGGTQSVVPDWRQTHAPLKQHLVVGWELLFPPLKQGLRGVVGSSPDPFRSTPAWHVYKSALHKWFPDLHDSGLFNQPYYDGVEPVLEALKKVHGDLSDGQRMFGSVLAHLRYHAPQGLITLDRRHQAIGPIYLGRVGVRHGKPHVVQIGVVDGIRQTLGGYFPPRSPAPSNTQPACRPGGERTSSGSGSTT